MKKILLIALALLTLGSQGAMAQKKEKKEKKTKKELKWDWDGTLSKNEEIDKYLLTIDTLWNKVQAYKQDFGTYQMRDTTFYNDKTQKLYRMAWMTDEAGNLMSRARINWQFAQAYAEGTLIVLDMTNAGLMSANAALTLPKLGLGALTFGKYVKGGPAVISEGTKTIKAIRGLCINNSRTWKEMKDGAVEDAASIGIEGFNTTVVEKLNKCFYIKEIQQDAPEYTEIITHYRNMTPEEIANEGLAIAQYVENSTEMPEDKSKTLNELPDLDKEMESL